MSAILKFLFVLVVTAVFVVAGAIVAFFGAILIGGVFGLDNQQGALAMGAATGAAPLGAVLGAGIGAFLGVRVSRDVPDGVAGAVALPALALVIGAGLFYWQPWVPPPEPDPDDAFRLGQERPIVDFEVKLDVHPDGEPPASVWHPLLRTRIPNLYVQWEDDPVRQEDGVSVLRMRTQLEFRHADRALELRRFAPPGDGYVFDVPLGEVPEPTADFSPWKRVDRVLSNGAELPAPEGLNVFVRWRVRAGTYGG